MSTGMESNRPNMDTILTDNPIIAGVRSLWEQDQLLDYTICVGHHEFKVHRVIMASMSDYFRTMLTGGMAESGKDVVSMEGVDADAMEALIHYIYTNQIDITKENVGKLLKEAVYLQIQPAIEKCTKFILENTEVDTCFEVLTLLRSYGCMDAVRDVEGYIKRNMRDIAKTSSLIELSYDDFCFIVGNWQSSEMDLFQLILKWSSIDKEVRKNNLHELLCLVRYSLMTPEQLSKAISIKKPDGIIKPWHPLIDKACEYHKLPLHTRILDNSEQTNLRTAPSFVSFSHSEAGYFYEPLQERCFIKHTGLQIPDNIGHVYGQTEINGFLVISSDGGDEHEEWHIFDPRTLQWEKMTDLHRFSDYAALAHNASQLYVVGGETGMYADGDEFTDTIEQYNFESKKWCTFNRLAVPVKLCGACIFNNGLYVSGGIPDHAHKDNLDAQLSRMDCLDLSSGKWESKSPMLSPRSRHSMHVMKILSEDVICVFDEDIFKNYFQRDMKFLLEVYNPSNDRWCSCSFTLSKALPLTAGSVTKWVRGNSVFLSLHDRNVAAVLTFAVDGTATTIDHIDEFAEDSIEETVLQIAPYTNQE